MSDREQEQQPREVTERDSSTVTVEDEPNGTVVREDEQETVTKTTPPNGPDTDTSNDR